MKLIIDTNLLFSAVSKPNGCYFSYIELFKHKNKLLKASKLDETDLLDVMYQIIKRIKFVNESGISEVIFEEAYKLAKDIDEKDTVFVAMSKHLDGKIWSGDKVLVEGLRRKGVENTILTSELLEILTEIS